MKTFFFGHHLNFRQISHQRTNFDITAARFSKTLGAPGLQLIINFLFPTENEQGGVMQSEAKSQLPHNAAPPQRGGAVWSRPLGVARLLGLRRVPPRTHPSEGVR